MITFVHLDPSKSRPLEIKSNSSTAEVQSKNQSTAIQMSYNPTRPKEMPPKFLEEIPTTFLEETLTVEVDVGKKAILGCLCEGSPWPHIKCSFNEKDVTEGGRSVL